MSSLVATSIRLAATSAIMRSTIADDRVFDSAITAIDKLAEDHPLPFVTVSTEEENSKPSGRDIWNGDSTVDLVIEAAISTAVQLPDDQGRALVFETTDATLELSLAILMRQISACLFGAGGGKWGDAFRLFASNVETVSIRRGVPIEGGTRFAARQAVYRLRTIADPPFAPVMAGTPWAALFAAADAEPDAMVAKAAQAIRGAIEGAPIGWPTLVNAGAVAAAFTPAEADAMGIAPAGGGGDVTVAGATTDPDGWPLDAAAAADLLPPEPSDG